MRKILAAAIISGAAALAMPAMAQMETVVNVRAAVDYVDPDSGKVLESKEYLSARQYPSVASCIEQLNNEGRAEMLNWARNQAPKLSSGKDAQIVIDLLACDKR
ncbi:hypothetical protein ACFOGJ_29120 [Marinibaculum pumilum]|uniref:UrcA family protein n=1 Tax=Marinibaculum pumilum TaxID=1766165 RepID=A0ABV7LAM0_9PROT